MTTNSIVSSILSDNYWNKKEITYSFRETPIYYEQPSDSIGATAPTQAMKSATEKIFNYIETFLPIHFIHTSSVADIEISMKQMDDPSILGYTYSPDSRAKEGGDLYINSSFKDIDFQTGGIGYSTLIHEIGHALGLLHPFGVGDYNGIDIHDTAMSYNPYQGYDDFNNHYFYTDSFSSYQSADILALQTLYGEKEDFNNNTYNLKDILYSNKIYGYSGLIQDNIHTIYDYAGVDTISLQGLSGYNEQFIDLRAGQESVVTDGDIHHYLFIEDRTNIENLTGSNYDDTIILNSLNNKIDTKDGNDSIYIYSDFNSELPRIDKLPNGTTIVASPSSGFDTLQNAENLYINDYIIDATNYQRSSAYYNDIDTASSIDRLYLASLDRLADADGLDYWLNDIYSGNTLNDIANSFVHSKEFLSLYPSQTDTDYIKLLYQNTLYRTPDQEGLSYWQEKMQEGESKADLLVSFANSQEFINLTGIYFDDQTVTVL